VRAGLRYRDGDTSDKRRHWKYPMRRYPAAAMQVYRRVEAIVQNGHSSIHRLACRLNRRCRSSDQTAAVVRQSQRPYSLAPNSRAACPRGFPLPGSMQPLSPSSWTNTARGERRRAAAPDGPATARATIPRISLRLLRNNRGLLPSHICANSRCRYLPKSLPC
jgi:hypothetical protein